jgi:hypothetical protein
MTTNPKTRKNVSKAAPVTSSMTARGTSKIRELVARYKWLEADQNYQTAIAPPENDADDRHYAEQERIISKLRTLVPQNYGELAALFRFALDDIKISDGLRSDRADLDMLSNIKDALSNVRYAERETARQEGMKTMREFLNERTADTFAFAKDPEVMKKIFWGNA